MAGMNDPKTFFSNASMSTLKLRHSMGATSTGAGDLN